MTKHKVYLAGPISGLSYAESALGWRDQFSSYMTDTALREIELFSPMRGKGFLEDRGILEGGYDDNPLATLSGIVCRDGNDVNTCDVMVACFLEAAEGVASLGTAIEFGWCDAYRKPIIMVAKPGDIHRAHPMLAQMSGYIVDDLKTAAALVEHILLPGI